MEATAVPVRMVHEPSTPLSEVEREALTLARRLFTRYVLGDTAGLAELFSEDSYARIMGDPALVPWAGVYVGPAQAAVFHQRCKDSIDLLEYTVLAFEPFANTVIVRATEHVRVKATGRAYQNEHVGIVTVRDGRIIRYLEYGDSARIEPAYQP